MMRRRGWSEMRSRHSYLGNDGTDIEISFSLQGESKRACACTLEEIYSLESNLSFRVERVAHVLERSSLAL
jgi:hypothetical protein